MTTAALAFPISRDASGSALSLPGVVGMYFAFRVCITFLLFQSSPQTGATVSVALNLLFVLPAAVYTFGPEKLTFGEAWKVTPFRLVLGFLALSLCSLIWSETSSKIIALGYWTAMAADVALVLLLARTDGASRTSDSLLKGFVCGVFLLCIVAWAAPVMPDLRLGDDEFLTPNIIGFECAFGALLCQYFAPQGARWRWLGIALAITLVRSLSKTSIVAFLIVEVFYLFRTATLKRSTKIAILAGAMLVAAAFSGLFASYYTVYTNAGNQAETLTGRTTIWLVTAGFAMQKPWLGYGFHSFRTVVPPFGPFQAWHAHNEVLQQLFDYGIAGVALVAILYTSFFRLCRRCRPYPLALTGISLLLLVLIRGLADTERFDLSFPLWAITAISLALADKQERPA